MKNTPIRTTSATTTGKDILKLFREKEKQFPGPTITSPVGDTEITLFGFWKNLHHESFGVNNDFFQTNRNSLKGVQLVARICSHFPVCFDFTALFQPDYYTVSFTHW